jgi:hypothetical protein
MPDALAAGGGLQMSEGAIAGYCALTFIFVVATLFLADTSPKRKRPWLWWIPLGIWIAPAIFKLWLAMALT